MPYHTISTIDLFGEGIDSARIVRRPWGLFEYVGIDVFRNQFHKTRFALLGALPDSTGMAAIYLPGNGGQLSLAGKTMIEGDVSLPDKGLSMGFLAGKWYEGKTLLHEGKMRRSAKLMPELDTAAMRNFSELEKWPTRLELSDLKKKRYPFSVDTVFEYHYPGEVVIDDTLSGNILVSSDLRIIVRASAWIQDAVLMADDIQVADGFSGSAQLMARHYLDIGKNCHLRYPSSLSLVGQLRDSLISIGDSSRLQGIIVLQGLDRTTSGRAKLRIHKNAIVEGFIYNNGNTEVEGSIWGHIATVRFEARGNNNYLLDATISWKKKHPDMPASFLWGHSKQVKVVKWLQ